MVAPLRRSGASPLRVSLSVLRACRLRSLTKERACAS
jgi:hypothetical protein